jgi:hypothetical protein
MNKPIEELRRSLFRAFENPEVEGKAVEEPERRSYIPLPMSKDLFLDIGAKFDLSPAFLATLDTEIGSYSRDSTSSILDFQAPESEC